MRPARIAAASGSKGERPEAIRSAFTKISSPASAGRSSRARVVFPAGCVTIAGMSLRSTADSVLQATERLQRLRGRLAELDQERAAVEREIGDVLKSIASAAATPVEPATPAPVKTAEKILATLKANPEMSFTALDLERMWNAKGGATLIGFRAALARLATKKKIARVKFGKYSAMR